MRDSKLSGLRTLYNMAISLGQKNKVKIRMVDETPIHEVIFAKVSNKWHPGTPGISTPPEIAVGTHFHA